MPACLCCGGGRTTLRHPETHAGPIWRCAQCGFCFVHPLPDKAYFDALYAGTPGDITYRPRQQSVFAHYLDVVMTEMSRQLSTRRRLLDVASGDGYFVEMAGARGLEAFGFDRAAHHASSPRCCSADIARFPFPDDSFDMCTLWSCLEHFTDPSEVIAECRRVTVRGGGIVISVPRADAVLHHLRQSRWSQYIPGHLGFYTRASLTHLLGRHHYTVRRIEHSHRTSLAQALVARTWNVAWTLEVPLLRSLMLLHIHNPLPNVMTVVAERSGD